MGCAESRHGGSGDRSEKGGRVGGTTSDEKRCGCMLPLKSVSVEWCNIGVYACLYALYIYSGMYVCGRRRKGSDDIFIHVC